MHRALTAALRASLCALALNPAAAPSLALTQCGEGSWYDHAGQPNASGRIIDPSTLTAAHPSLPFGSKVEVENLDNGRTVILEIDDRGPFTQGRIIDVSRAATEELGFKGDGVTQVRVIRLLVMVACAARRACIRQVDCGVHVSQRLGTLRTASRAPAANLTAPTRVAAPQ